MKAADRAERDELVMALFAAGLSLRQIADRVGLASPQSVANIVRRESPLRHRVLIGAAGAIFVERTEALLRANMPAALRGDYKAAAIVTRVLDRQARFYGLYGATRDDD
ncbi:hypothetical protein MTY66_00070 [Mycolicibacterium sp. TY66]|uniref:hypothetical protein n=1 Tax=unclassified Mycolicibacterium TaxID=2636767 RepID=UPI001BB3A580|nr:MULTISPECIES: hypothetical protein [unclassified Mycolicibacterium]BCI78382.1 hypothetical protein MTY66_00070 [Mycolicibacterium sp. TY66]BCJ83956.1 hypothetical protein MTY81_53290 [Mycolicibacterium sp. TY81]